MKGARPKLVKRGLVDCRVCATVNLGLSLAAAYLFLGRYFCQGRHTSWHSLRAHQRAHGVLCVRFTKRSPITKFAIALGLHKGRPKRPRQNCSVVVMDFCMPKPTSTVLLFQRTYLFFTSFTSALLNPMLRGASKV